MRSRHFYAFVFAVAIAGALTLLGACGKRAGEPTAPVVAAPEAATTPAPPFLFDDLGPLHRPISTKNADAQRYFDQGLRLVYAFNHQAAGFAFAEAARLEPNCAICWWGQALVLGPNINLPMQPEAAAPAWANIQKAIALREHASPVEQALIDALATRYAENPPEDRSALDQAYAAAMRDVVAKFPDDLDAATMFAESLMDLMPWAYWDKQRQPNTHTLEMMKALESVLARDPDHIGAVHYYIHATEGSADPAVAEPYADRLALVSPGAGHLVHMPAHTYIRIGRYHDATLNNMKATDADAAFLMHCRGSNGMYPLGYVPHNWHFMTMTAGLEGSSAMSIRAAEQTAQRTDKTMLDKLTFMQQFLVAPLYARVRFAKWDEILAQAAPPSELPYPKLVWHFARGMALANKGDTAAATKELETLRELAKDPSLPETVFFDINAATKVTPIAEQVLVAEIARVGGRRDESIAALRAAVAAEDELNYNEPPDWPVPVRPYLGDALLAAGDSAGAAAVYVQDLENFPENGWSLVGLREALIAQNSDKAAADVEARRAKAWEHADVEIHRSRL